VLFFQLGQGLDGIGPAAAPQLKITGAEAGIAGSSKTDHGEAMLPGDHLVVRL